MPSSIKSTSVFIFASLLVACSTRHEVAEDYRQLIKTDGVHASRRTVVFFLIDGLQLKMVQTELGQGHLPNIDKYFVGGEKSFYKARTTFPSLTFPAISSLLTENTIDRHGVSGNEVFKDGRTLNFEGVDDYPELNKLIAQHSVFSRLKAKGLRSVSLDFAFHSGASVALDSQDIEAGVAIVNRDYAYVDNKVIDSLKLLLTQTAYEQWPDFIFVHLVGVDFTSHDQGPSAKSVAAYLRALDSRLESVFRTLKKAENGRHRQIIAMLSADHGFDNTTETAVAIEPIIKKSDPGIRVLNEGRVMQLFFPHGWPENKTESFLSTIHQMPGVDFVANRSGSRIAIQSATQNVNIDYANSTACSESSFALRVTPTSSPVCPDQLDPTTRGLFYPYLIPDLAYFFKGPYSPDAIVVAKSGMAFNKLYQGNHGGPTEQETFVPLFLHGATVPALDHIPTLWELLRFM